MLHGSVHAAFQNLNIKKISKINKTNAINIIKSIKQQKRLQISRKSRIIENKIYNKNQQAKNTYRNCHKLSGAAQVDQEDVNTAMKFTTIVKLNLFIVILVSHHLTIIMPLIYLQVVTAQLLLLL